MWLRGEIFSSECYSWSYIWQPLRVLLACFLFWFMMNCFIVPTCGCPEKMICKEFILIVIRQELARTNIRSEYWQETIDKVHTCIYAPRECENCKTQFSPPFSYAQIPPFSRIFFKIFLTWNLKTWWIMV